RFRLGGFRSGQRHLRDRRAHPRRGRPRLPRRRPGARHALRRRGRAAVRDRGGRPSAAADAGLKKDANGGSRVEFGRTIRYSLRAIRYPLRGASMTYCCGILVRDGLVMIADTRTNAGLDNISVFRKLHTYALPDERIMAIASSGNLSLSQSVLSIL